MSRHAIHVDNVHKSFGGRAVLAGLDLAVEEGQIFALLGCNGAGKTTLVSLLLGLQRRDAGSIAVLGRDPQDQPLQVRESVGFLAEDQQMFGWMTVPDILGFMAPFYPTWDRELATRLVRRFELPTTTRIQNLSKGHTVRLGLVLALAHRPRLVILDDPALGLDPIVRKEFNRDLIAHLQGEGATVLYSSHLLYEVEPIADAVAILDRGRIVRHAGTDDLRADVKQLVFAAEEYAVQKAKLDLLDVRHARGEVAATVARAPEAIERLAAEGARFRVIDLNLDDIFAAYVIGRTEQPGDTAPAAAEPLPV
jgi:ABC-2 type transport system ATP-binding protein